ncbi:MAG: tRNA dihydrouridine synthase DusB [Pseudomonadota bacterium]
MADQLQASRSDGVERCQSALKQPPSAPSIAGSAIRYRNPVLLAPMSGVTDAPFRNLAFKFGAGAVISEMVASRGLCTGQAEMVLKASNAGIRPNIVQLAGREPEWMAEATRIVIDAGADVVDINMGCPARKVTSGYSGSALMREPDLARRLIEATVCAAQKHNVPVTLKMRLGWDDDTRNAADVARMAADCGVELFTVHGRTRCQFYKGVADWPAVAEVVDAVTQPVVVNGDIGDIASARMALEQSGASAIMVGRAAYGKPWLAGALSTALETGADILVEPSAAQRLDIARAHLEALLSHYGIHLGLRSARKHLAWYLDPLAGRSPWIGAMRQDIVRCDDPDRVMGCLAQIGQRLADGDESHAVTPDAVAA